MAQFTMRYRHGTLPFPCPYYGFPFVLVHLPHRLLYLAHPPARPPSPTRDQPPTSTDPPAQWQAHPGSQEPGERNTPSSYSYSSSEMEVDVDADLDLGPRLEGELSCAESLTNAHDRNSFTMQDALSFDDHAIEEAADEEVCQILHAAMGYYTLWPRPLPRLPPKWEAPPLPSHRPPSPLSTAVTARAVPQVWRGEERAHNVYACHPFQKRKRAPIQRR